jgi:hypothetical protein
VSVVGAVVEGLCRGVEECVRAVEDVVALVAAGLMATGVTRFPRVRWCMDNLGFGSFIACTLLAFLVALSFSTTRPRVTIEECTELCNGQVWSWSAFDCQCHCR